MTARGILVAAPRSGCGKTTVTVGLLAALRRRGFSVRAAKSGPDYIDPAFHAAAAGTPGFNLDTWAMPPRFLDTLMADSVRDCDILVVEAAMGLFDGVPAPSRRTGAAADLAVRYGLPVLLVLDVSGQMQSAAAVVRGFASHDPSVRIAGVILNRVSGERHRAYAADAIEAAGMRVLGALPKDDSIRLPERHLGLVQAGEHDDIAVRIGRLADAVEQNVDVAAVIACASMPSIESPTSPGLPPPGQRVALASDAAFSFVYPHLLQSWRDAGAEVTTFSPLADEPPPDGCDACWLPGGYPELHAGTLAAAGQFRRGLVHFARTRPVHGECGGYMVLGKALDDAEGTSHAMVGLLGHATSFARRKLHLGYREARLLADGPLGREGALIRGHEFHYATLLTAGSDEPFVTLVDAQGSPMGAHGARRGHVTGTFFHAIAAV